MNKNLLLLTFSLLCLVNAIAQPETFKYRVFLGHGRCLQRYYTDANGKRTYEFYDISKTHGGSVKDPKFSRLSKMTIATRPDTLIFNFWLMSDKKNKIDKKDPLYCDKLIANPNDFNKDYTYFIYLPNRQTRSFSYLNFEVSALTAPIKFRFGHSFKGSYTPAGSNVSRDTTTKVLSQAVAQVNLNLNLALRFGKVRYTGDKFAGVQSKNVVSGIAGVFAGFGVLQVDATNTTAKFARNSSDTAAFVTRTVPSMSIGASLGLNIRNVDFLFMFGYEFPLVQHLPWDFIKSPFIGFGIGYGSALFK